MDGGSCIIDYQLWGSSHDLETEILDRWTNKHTVGTAGGGTLSSEDRHTVLRHGREGQGW